MSQLSIRDLAIIGAISALGLGAAVLAVSGLTGWAIALVAILTAVLGVLSRLQFVARRNDTRRQIFSARGSNRMLKNLIRKNTELSSELQAIRAAQRRTYGMTFKATSKISRKVDAVARYVRSPEAGQVAEGIAALRSEIRGVRVSQQIVSHSLSGLTRDLGNLALPESEADSLHEARTGVGHAVDATVSAAGWPDRPTDLVYLLGLIDRSDASLVVECASGVSTLWLAMAMRAKGGGLVVSLEDREDRAEETRRMLAEEGLLDWARVIDCPVSTVRTRRGSHRWYGLDLQELPTGIDILLVNRPSADGSGGDQYPAPVILSPLQRQGSMIVLDSSQQTDAVTMVKLWTEEGVATRVSAAPVQGLEVLRWLASEADAVDSAMRTEE